MSHPPNVEDLSSFWMKMNEVHFIHAFIASFSVIIVSELGDKTFFIAAIMAMRHNRWAVFTAAFGALIIMTLLSVFMGMATSFIPRTLTHYLSSLLFVIFGLKMLREGWLMSDDEGKEEYEEVQKDLAKVEGSGDMDYNIVGNNNGSSTEDPETGVMRSVRTVPLRIRLKRRMMQCFSLIFIETLTMTFVAEWGDRSQIATIILAAREDVIGVTLGAIMGHAICTALAVIGGRFIAMIISVRTVTLIGGVVFIIFACSALLLGPE